MRINPIGNQTFTANRFYKFRENQDTEKVDRAYNRLLREGSRFEYKTIYMDDEVIHRESLHPHAYVYRNENGILHLTGKDQKEFVDTINRMKKNNPDDENVIDVVANEYIKKAEIVNDIDKLDPQDFGW